MCLDDEVDEEERIKEIKENVPRDRIEEAKVKDILSWMQEEDIISRKERQDVIKEMGWDKFAEEYSAECWFCEYYRVDEELETCVEESDCPIRDACCYAYSDRNRDFKKAKEIFERLLEEAY